MFSLRSLVAISLLGGILTSCSRFKSSSITCPAVVDASQPSPTSEFVDPRAFVKAESTNPPIQTYIRTFGDFYVFKTNFVSPNGKWLAQATDQFDDSEPTITILNLRNGRRLQKLRGHEDNINALAFSPDSQLIVSASQDGTAKVWHRESGKLLHTLNETNTNPATDQTDSESQWIAPVNAVAFSDDGQTVALNHTREPFITLWDACTGEKKPQEIKEEVDFEIMLLSPNSEYIVLMDDENVLHVFDVETGDRLYSQFTGHEVNTIAISPDSQTIATGAEEVKEVLINPITDTRREQETAATTRLWDIETGKLLQTIPHQYKQGPLAFTTDGQAIARSFQRSTGTGIRFWHIETGALLETLSIEESDAKIADINFTPDGKTVRMVEGNGSVHQWTYDSSVASDEVPTEGISLPENVIVPRPPQTGTTSQKMDDAYYFAQQATELEQTANSVTDWRAVVVRWWAATLHMKAVSFTNIKHEVAETKQEIYQQNLLNAIKNAVPNYTPIAQKPQQITPLGRGLGDRTSQWVKGFTTTYFEEDKHAPKLVQLEQSYEVCTVLADFLDNHMSLPGFNSKDVASSRAIDLAFTLKAKDQNKTASAVRQDTWTWIQQFMPTDSVQLRTEQVDDKTERIWFESNLLATTAAEWYALTGEPNEQLLVENASTLRESGVDAIPGHFSVIITQNPDQPNFMEVAIVIAGKVPNLYRSRGCRSGLTG